MKTKILTASLVAFLSVLLISCDESVTTGTIVNKDGSIVRRIALLKTDSVSVNENIYGVNRENGWEVTFNESEGTSSEETKPVKEKNYDVVFTKTFNAVDDLNAELNSENPALFRIKSTLDSRFRWFYTYHKYSDTFISLNRFRELSQDEYFTVEDHAFIKRLPAEGRAMSKADSIYLQQLNTKIFDQYALRAFYEEHYKDLIASLKENEVEQSWIDTVAFYKEDFFVNVVQKDDDLEDDFILRLLDRIKAPLPLDAIHASYKTVSSDFDKRIKFMTKASELKYDHAIELPWDILDSNADSVNGTRAFWRPPVTKFLLSDLTLEAEARSLNLWTVVVSLLILAATVYLFARRN